jgi:outer membrane protein OmpU
MNKFKKIGLTALAGSLVATSAFAADWSMSGGASIDVNNVTGTNDPSTGKNWSMGNEINISGSGELDNGMTVTLAFQLDQGAGAGLDSATDTGKPFDNHSITVASDMFGTLVFSGHGGSSAQGALDTTAAGDIWNNTLGVTGPAAAASGNDSLYYTLPSLVDGLAINLSMSPGRAAQETHTSYAATYSGVEGLSVSYGKGDSGAPGAVTEHTTMKASYAYGPVTVAASQTEVDYKSSNDKDYNSWKVAYTLTDDISIHYGSETVETVTKTVDEEVENIGISYTTGGVTISANTYEAKGAGNTASAKTEKWALAASFAF